MKNGNLKVYQENHKIHKDEYINDSDNELSETEEGSSTEVVINISLLKQISDILNSIISENKKTENSTQENSPFRHDNIPNISLFDYLFRIQKYTGIENSTLIIALIYIDRICHKKKLTLTKFNIHRLLFTSIIASIKYNEDIIYNNLFYSKIGGITETNFNIKTIYSKIFLHFKLYIFYI